MHIFFTLLHIISLRLLPFVKENIHLTTNLYLSLQKPELTGDSGARKISCAMKFDLRLVKYSVILVI